MKPVSIFAIIVIYSVPTESGITPLRKRVFGETSLPEPTWLCITRMKADNTWKHIKSPGYPKSMDMKQSRCSWKITATKKVRIRIAFRGIGLAAEDPEHCSSNYLEIIDETIGKSQGRLCGRKTEGDIVTQGNKVRFDLQRDPSEKYQRGFFLSFKTTTAKPGFYSKKSFNDPPLPPLKPKSKKPTSKAEEVKKSEKPVRGGVPIISANGVLITQDSSEYNTGREKSQSKGSKSKSEQMSILAIIGIVIGCAFGVLILVLVVRKILLTRIRGREKDKDGNSRNSGLPQINMTHDGVVRAKKNILSPAIVVNPNDDSRSPTPYVNSSDNGTLSSQQSSEEENRMSFARHRNEMIQKQDRISSRVQVTGQNLVETEGNKPNQLPINVRISNGINACRDVPLRGNLRQEQSDPKMDRGRDNIDAIEALNNERFRRNSYAFIRPGHTKKRSILGFSERKKNGISRKCSVSFVDAKHTTSEKPGDQFNNMDRMPRQYARQIPLSVGLSPPAQGYNTKFHFPGRRMRSRGLDMDRNGSSPNALPQLNNDQTGKGRPRGGLRGRKKSLSNNLSGTTQSNDITVPTLNEQNGTGRFNIFSPQPSVPRHVVPSSRRGRAPGRKVLESPNGNKS